jgi:hypothetical protein
VAALIAINSALASNALLIGISIIFCQAETGVSVDFSMGA